MDNNVSTDVVKEAETILQNWVDDSVGSWEEGGELIDDEFDRETNADAIREVLRGNGDKTTALRKAADIFYSLRMHTQLCELADDVTEEQSQYDQSSTQWIACGLIADTARELYDSMEPSWR